MGTRAVYSFKSHGESYHVYKHWDNSPENAADFIENACTKAWPLGRFEADEFAAAFIAANKIREGDIRLIRSPAACGDAAYYYQVTFDCLNNRLQIVALNADGKRIFSGSVPELRSFGKKLETV